MHRMAGHYFRRNGDTSTLPNCLPRNDPLTPLESKEQGEKNKVSAIPEENDNKKAHLTATYWG